MFLKMGEGRDRGRGVEGEEVGRAGEGAILGWLICEGRGAGRSSIAKGFCRWQGWRSFSLALFEYSVRDRAVVKGATYLTPAMAAKTLAAPPLKAAASPAHIDGKACGTTHDGEDIVNSSGYTTWSFAKSWRRDNGP